MRTEKFIQSPKEQKVPTTSLGLPSSDLSNKGLKGIISTIQKIYSIFVTKNMCKTYKNALQFIIQVLNAICSGAIHNPRHIKPQTCQTQDTSNPRNFKPRTHQTSEKEYRAVNKNLDRNTFFIIQLCFLLILLAIVSRNVRFQQAISHSPCKSLSYV